MRNTQLAIEGGTPVRTEAMPTRALIGAEEKRAVMEVFDEAILSGEAIGYNGKYEQEYEQSFAAFMGGGFADAVNSGTNALFVALGALQLKPFSEVIVPPITDAGGAMPVVMVGCVPVMADADPRCYNTCAEEIERVITERTRAIIVAHIPGEPADLEPICRIAKEHNLYIIEDCSQAHGAKYQGRMVGTSGDMATFSTMFSKHHCTGGQGGVVYTQDEDLYWRAKRFADRGKPFNIEGELENVVAGLNCNLNDLSAAIGTVQLKKLEKIIANRRRVADGTREGLQQSVAVSMGWQVPDTEPVYWFMRLKLDLDAISVNKIRFCNALKKEGIPVSPHFRYIPCEMPWFKQRAGLGRSGFPWSCSDYKGPRNPEPKTENANYAIETHFNIPFNENYGPQEIQDITDAILKVETAYLR